MWRKGKHTHHDALGHGQVDDGVSQLVCDALLHLQPLRVDAHHLGGAERRCGSV